MSWTTEAYKSCTHPCIEEVKNGFDRTIGYQCASCLKVLGGIGKCDGCGKDPARLTWTVDGARYCGEQCRKDELARRRTGQAPPRTSSNR